MGGILKIFTQGYNPEKQGGGHSFLRNFRKCFEDQLVETPEECDIYFITSISMLSKLSEIPKDKKIVLRVDNILKRSNNRDIYPFEGDKVTMMEALKLVAKKADLVVYQSEWAKDLLDDFLKPNRSVVILNSGDEFIFNPDGGKLPTEKNIYFYSRSSNHDNKGWHIAWYEFQEIFKQDKNAELWITGRFSPENIPNNFDFFRGESWKYFGHISDPEAMAMYFRTAKKFLYTYHRDACSNTLVECLLSGCEPILYDRSGGAYEIMEILKYNGIDYFKLPRMKREYDAVFKKLLKIKE